MTSSFVRRLLIRGPAAHLAENAFVLHFSLEDPRAIPAIDRLAYECIEGPFDLIERQRTEKPLEQHFLMVEGPASIEP